LTAKRSGTAFDRCCKNAVNIRSYLDIAIWIALSDLSEILVLYFGVERNLKFVSARMLINDTAKMVFYFIETIYFALYLMYRNKQGYEIRSYLLSMAIFGVFCQSSFIQLMRFGIVIAKFFTLEQFTNNLLSQTKNCHRMCLIGTFWFDQILFTCIIVCTISILLLLIILKYNHVPIGILNPITTTDAEFDLNGVELKNNFESETNIFLEMENSLFQTPENLPRKACSNADSDSNHSISSLQSQEIIKLLEETRDDECLSESFRHLVVKLIQRNDLEGLRKTFRNSNRYWPIEDLVYFMEVMIQYSRFEMLEVIKEDLDEHGLFSNHNQELYNIHPIVMLGLKKIGALEVNISILNLYEDMFYDALDEDGNRLIHLFAIHGRSLQLRALITLNPQILNIRSSIGLTALDYAEKDSRVLLLKFKAQHSLHGIARIGDIQAAEGLISKFPNEVENVNKYGETALHVAAIFGQARMIQLLIHRNANVNAINFDGWTPLDEAIASGQTASIDVLCTHEAVQGYFEHSRDLDHGISSKSKFKRDEMNNYT